jgi:hypothetical protein
LTDIKDSPHTMENRIIPPDRILTKSRLIPYLLM